MGVWVSTMPPNVKNLVEEPERSWADHSASNSFIDLDISLDLVPSKDYGRRASSSHRPKAKETRNGNAWYARSSPPAEFGFCQVYQSFEERHRIAFEVQPECLPVRNLSRDARIFVDSSNVREC